MRKSCFLLLLGLFLKFSNLEALRIVSLAPYLTEELIILEAKDQIVGITSVGKTILNLNEIDTVGDTLNVSIEKILMLKPDLILATPMNKPAVINKLRSLGFNVKVFEMGKDFQDCCSIFLKLSKLVGKEKKANKIIKEINEQLQKLKDRVQKCPKPKVFIIIDNKPLITAGRDCYLNQMIAYAGGINIANKWGRGFFRIGVETVLQANPDFIISICEQQNLKYWYRFSSLTAVKNNRVYHLDPDVFSRPNPLNFLRGVELLSFTLHPELKNEN